MGKTNTPEHKAWYAARLRCYSTTDKQYKNYGGRGIFLSKEWECFETFLKDMGTRPSPSHELDRIDNNKGYCKENCRWTTKSQNLKNRRYKKSKYGLPRGITRRVGRTGNISFLGRVFNPIKTVSTKHYSTILEAYTEYQKIHLEIFGTENPWTKYEDAHRQQDSARKRLTDGSPS